MDLFGEMFSFTCILNNIKNLSFLLLLIHINTNDDKNL